MIIEGMDYNVYYLPFPLCVKGVIERGEEGKVNIYLNSNCPVETQRNALKHELRHCELNHPYQIDKPVQICEDELTQDPVLRQSVFDRFGNLIFKGAMYATH